MGGVVSAATTASRFLMPAILRPALHAPKRLSKQEKKSLRAQRIISGVKARKKQAREEAKRRRLEERKAAAQDLDLLGEDARLQRKRDAALRRQKRVEECKAAKAALRERLHHALDGGLRIAVDCSYNDRMNERELKSLAKQLAYAYGSNRRAEIPAALIVCGLAMSLPTMLPMGFEHWVIGREQAEACSAFPKEEIVYLTPDAETALDTLNAKRIYVIGGFVDNTVQKRVTLSRAQTFGVETARLPLKEHGRGTSRILNVNHVVELLLAFHQTGSWLEAMDRAIPDRKRVRPGAAQVDGAPGPEAPDLPPTVVPADAGRD